MSDDLKSNTQLISELEQLRSQIDVISKENETYNAEKIQAENIQKVLLNISRATGETKNLEGLLKIIHEQVGTLIDARNFFVALYDANTKTYSFPYYVDEFEAEPEFTQEEMQYSLTEYVRNRNTPLLIDEQTDQKLVENGEVGVVGKLSLMWLGVPFSRNENINGVVVTQSYSKKYSYTQKDLELMTFVSQHIAWAIERKQSETELRESENRYRRLVDNSPLSIVIYSEKKIVFVNQKTVQTFGGKSAADFIGKEITAFVHPDYKTIGNHRMNYVNKNEEVHVMEQKAIRLDGEIIDIEVMAAPTNFGGKYAVQLVIADITERKKVENSLRLSEESYRGLFDNATDAIYIQDENGIFLDVNKSAVNMYGYEHNFFIGKSPEVLSAPGKNDLEKVKTQIQDAIKGKPQVFEFWGKKKNGEIFLKEVRLNKGTYFGKPVIIAFAQDITERRKAIIKIEESERRFRNLIESSPVAICMTREEKVIFANKSYFELFGINTEDEIIGHSFLNQISKEERDKIAALAKNRIKEKVLTSQYESIGYRKNGETFPFHANVSLIELKDGLARLVYITDISELRNAEKERLNLERQILQTQKLESLGVLAGGIAHDFNNLLTGIMGNTGLAMIYAGADSRASNNLKKIEQIAERAAELCNQMLAYSGKGKFVIQSVNVNEIIQDMVLLLNVSIPKNVMLDLKLDEKISAVDADVAQMRQIIMNLITNAADALEKKYGVINVSTFSGIFTVEELHSPYIEHQLKDGKYVIIEVKDNGIGMTQDTLQKLFDPFFTTKFTGRGLGLAAVLGIVRGHKGSINIESEPGTGTSIRIFLPASENKSESLVKSKSAEEYLNGSGTLLIVDDEESVRSILKESLEYSGFKVILAEDGEQAIKRFKKYSKEIRLVLLDMTMPKLNGEETFKRLVQIDPAVKVILSSGFNTHEAGKRFAGKGLSGYLQKPYHLQTLRQKIRQVLEEKN